MEYLPVDVLKKTAACLTPFDVAQLCVASKKLNTHHPSLTAKAKDLPSCFDDKSCARIYCDVSYQCKLDNDGGDKESFSLSTSSTSYVSREGLPLYPKTVTAPSARTDFVDAAGLFASKPMAVAQFRPFDTANVIARGHAKHHGYNIIIAPEEPRSPRPRIDFTNASDLFTDHPMAVSYFQSGTDMADMSFDEDSVPPIIYVFEEY
mmetsp:Transcript_21438/g.34329  ORF Transcript_21438/g.34329 Transcript_21438/m.34329 type:complete len:206 (+) Transcript_21438:1-618(+)